MERLHEGDQVSGIVVARAPFGAWIDLGLGFPAMIELPRIAELAADDYQRGDWCHVGSPINATVHHAEAGHIRLSQKPSL